MKVGGVERLEKCVTEGRVVVRGGLYFFPTRVLGVDKIIGEVTEKSILVLAMASMAILMMR